MSSDILPSAQSFLSEQVNQGKASKDVFAIQSRYRGAYLGRSFVRHASRPGQLYDVNINSVIDTLATLYPEELSGKLDSLRKLEKERGLLTALRDGIYTPPDGIIRFRGREVSKRELPTQIEILNEECAAAQQQVFRHDQQCRSAHRIAAMQLGKGWDKYLDGLLALVHYAEHQQANLADSRALLNNTYAVVTADRNVSKREIKRLVAAGSEVFDALAAIYRVAPEVRLPESLLQKLEIKSWSDTLGEFGFVSPTPENISHWLNAVDSWISSTMGWLNALRQLSLEQLLLTEGQIALWVSQGEASDSAPAPAQIPDDYPTLTPGEERALQTRLGLWDRFQTADGLVAGSLRLLVATSIIGGALLLTAAPQVGLFL